MLFEGSPRTCVCPDGWCRQLCVFLNAEDIYRTMSSILLVKDDLRFASHMVQTLNTILLTSTELFELRNQLKDLKTQVGRPQLLPSFICFFLSGSCFL